MFLHKLPGYFQGSMSQNKFQAFQGYKGAVETLIRHLHSGKKWAHLMQKSNAYSKGNFDTGFSSFFTSVATILSFYIDK